MTNATTEMDGYTHKGWFCLCPIYIANLETGEPTLEARRWVPEWWFTCNEIAFGLVVQVTMTFKPDFEPLFPILVTGELK